MYSLPDEILELIVQQNEDSIRTLISWSLISPYIQNLVSKEIGVITIQDGLEAPLENLLGYQCLVSNDNICNHLNINSDDIDDEYIMTEEQSFTYFISQFENLLLVIESTRPYCGSLTNTLTRIANSCHKGINVCVFYKTHNNFLSKLYFKQFKLIAPHISLTELYLFGNNESIGFENNLIDIDTLFKTVHIEQIKTIYSLDIIDDNIEFNGSELTTIKKINYHESVNINHFLRHCIKIKNIDYLRFPIIIDELQGKYTFNIPQCEEITLCEYNNDVSHPMINGAKVTQKLSLKPTLRTSDPTFENLYFPHIKTLNFPIFDFKTINFNNCDFPTVRHLNVEGCMIPWSNLNSLVPFNNIEIKLTISLRLTDWQQLKWLKSCPFKIENLEIIGNEIQFLPTHFISDDPPLDESLNFKGLNDANKIESITLHMNSLDQINLLQEIVSNDENSCSQTSSLKIIINEAKLRESIIMNKNYNFNQELVIPISKLNHLTILLLDQNVSNHQSFFQRGRLLSNESMESHKNDIDYSYNCKLPSRKWNDETKLQIPTISPSQFRKNSIAGLPIHEVRRQSIISFDSIGPNAVDTTFERRRSSLDSVSLFSNHVYSEENAIDDYLEHGELATLKLQGTTCPDILTVNLNSIDSSVIHFDDLPKEMKIPLLQIWFTPDTPFTTYEALVSNLTNKIINMVHYPFEQIISQPSFQKLQLFVDMTRIKEKFEVPITFQSVSNDLSYALSKKGHLMDFIKYNPNDRELVAKSPNFSICIDV